MRPDKDYYMKFAYDALALKLRQVRDRMTRADSSEAYLADAYDEQEICAAMDAKRKGVEQ